MPKSATDEKLQLRSSCLRQEQQAHQTPRTLIGCVAAAYYCAEVGEAGRVIVTFVKENIGPHSVGRSLSVALDPVYITPFSQGWASGSINASRPLTDY